MQAMKIGHIKQALTALKVAYPEMPTPSEETAGIWFAFFHDKNPNDFMRAVKEHILTSEKWPRINVLNAVLENTGVPQWDEKLARIFKAVRVFGVYAEVEAQQFLGAELWQVVELFSWKEICLCEISQLNTLRAQVRNAIVAMEQRATLARNREKIALSVQTQNLLGLEKL